jgi:hypothetical protein
VPLRAEEYLMGLLLCCQPVPLISAAATVTFLLVVGVLWRRCRPLLGVSMVWIAAFLAPLTLSAGPTHRYYLPEAGYALMYAAAAGMAPWRRWSFRDPCLCCILS